MQYDPSKSISSMYSFSVNRYLQRKLEFIIPFSFNKVVAFSHVKRLMKSYFKPGE